MIKYISSQGREVAPLAGAWIEIFSAVYDCSQSSVVAPLAGAWIEIPYWTCVKYWPTSRSPRGSVD